MLSYAVIFFFDYGATMSLTNNGTGLRVIKSPMGLKLSSSPFTAQPDEEVAAIDVYEVKSAGVINSISDDTGADDSFFGKIKNAISGGLSGLMGGLANLKLPSLPSLPSIPGMPGMPGIPSAGGALGALQSGAGALRAVTNVAGRALSAANQFQKGGIMGKISGLASLGGMSGIQGAAQMAGMARGVAYGVSQGGIGGVLMAGGALAGNQGRSLTQLASNVTSLQRSVASVSRAIGSGNISGALYSLDSSLAVTTNALGNLDKASQANFQDGFNSVFASAPQSGQRAYNQNAQNQVRSALNDYTGGFSNTGRVQPSTRAGTVAGLAVVGSSYGDNNIYSLARTSGLDDESAYLTGTALTTYGAKTGNIELLSDLRSDPVGLKAIASNPKALQHTVTNMVPTSNQLKKPYAAVYDDLDDLSQDIGQSWNQTSRAGDDIVDVSCVRRNSYATQIVAAKASEDNFKTRITQTKIESTTATLSVSQTMVAATSLTQTTTRSIMETNPDMDRWEASTYSNDNDW